MATYWGTLKDGSLRIYEKAPKCKHVVEERVGRSREQHIDAINHKFTCGEVVREFISYCGYDRGPRKRSIIKKMLA